MHDQLGQLSQHVTNIFNHLYKLMSVNGLFE